MKKIILLIVALFPIVGFSQVDLATWALTSNGNVTTSQTFVTASNISYTGSTPTYSASGLALANFNDNALAHYRYFQITIKPTSGNVLNLTNLLFNQSKLSQGPTHYGIKYYISNDGTIPGDYDFFTNNSTWLVNQESISANGTKNIALSQSLTSSQTMVIRFYAKGANDYNLAGWIIGANTLKIKGTSPSLVLTANNDTATVSKNTATDIDVISNDSAPNPITSVIIATQPANGTVSVNPDKTINFVPTTGFTGATSFTYTIGDGSTTSTATVNINVIVPAPTGALCGTYVIGSTPQTEYYQFATITQAVTYLNANGVSCAVNFLLNDATYTSSTETFPITINQFTGSSETNTVTFSPNTGKTVEINCSNSAVFKSNGADYVIFNGSNNNSTSKDLTIYNTTTTDYSNKTVFWAYGGANYNSYKNLIIKQNIININSDVHSSGIFVGGSSIGGSGNNPNGAIDNVTFTDVKQAIYVNSTSTGGSAGWKINNVNIGSDDNNNKPFLGIYLYNTNSYIVSNNKINGVRKPSGVGGSVNNTSAIMIDGSGTIDGEIYSNTINNIRNDRGDSMPDAYGIWVNKGNAKIHNNIINEVVSAASYANNYGIYVKEGASKIYYNTVQLSGNEANSTSTSIYINSGTGIEVKNNIFVNTKTAGSNRYAIYKAGGTFASNGISNNNYYSTQYLGYSSGNKTFTEWTALTSETGSKNVLPNFISATDLHLIENTNSDLSNTGTPIGSVIDDIDGEIRHLTTPDIGADELIAACTPTGDPTVYGDNTWNVYGYNQNSFTLNSANYKGYYTQSTLGIDTTTAWSLNNSPSTATVSGTNTAWQGCSLGGDYFTFVYKRKGFPAGSYELRMIGWDDDARVYVNGVEVQPGDFIGWSGNTDQNILAGTFCLNANSTIEIVTVEYTGDAKLKMNLIATSAIYNNGWAGTAENNSIEIQSDLVINSDLDVCTCTVKAGSTLTINGNKSLVVQDAIVVETGGTLIVENNANLVQVNDTAAASNSGSIQVERESSPVKQYDYVYWSSPVVGTTMQTLSNPSMYYRFNTLTNSWAWMSASDIMQKGVGYIARVSNYLNFNGPLSPTVLATFNGAQHSGVVNVDVNGTNATKFNLIGNPYPSAIDAEAFILANASKITGTLYIWTHQTAISSNNPGSEANNYTSDDYAKFNLVGGVGTGMPSNTGSAAPNGYIPSCQGFYVETTSNGAQQLLFNNSMRVAGANTNNQFFKPAPTETDQTIYKHRVWLNISNTEGAYCETLLGYVTGATNELDNLYDGKTVPAGNYVSLYSILGTQPLAIQGRGLPFSDADIIPLGYSTTITGNLTISLGQFDGLFDGQDVFLVDKTNNVYTNLKDINYTFQTATGTFTDRFELRFVNETLGIENPTIDQNAMMVIRNGNQIQVKSNELTIDQVIVYDLQGRVIFDKKNINAQEFFTGQLNASNQVVIVKVIADNDAELVKKVIMN